VPSGRRGGEFIRLPERLAHATAIAIGNTNEALLGIILAPDMRQRHVRRRPEVVAGRTLEEGRQSCTGKHPLAEFRWDGTGARRRVEDNRELCPGTTSGGTQPDGGQHRLEDYRTGRYGCRGVIDDAFGTPSHTCKPKYGLTVPTNRP
jgi:hypothetical protein